MRSNVTHPVLCLVAFSAYLLNYFAVAGGAVICQEPEGVATIEFSCEHDHCETQYVDSHDHESSEETCQCGTCECEDTLLTIEIAPASEDDRVLEAGIDDYNTFSLVESSELWLVRTSSLHMERPPPANGRQLVHLRTVILIV